MRKKSKWFIAILSLVLIMSCFAGCGGTDTPADDDNQKPPEDEIVVPDEVQVVKDKVTTLAETYALKLDGEWGDKHAALMASKEGRDYADFESMRAVLDGFREESGAYYVYALFAETAEDENFLITVDASDPPDDWLTEYEWEIQFKEAWEGTPAAARSAWDDDVDDPCWSAFAPIHDSEGKVVAILGIDFPAPEIVDFPEWNRDSEVWNGIEE